MRLPRCASLSRALQSSIRLHDMAVDRAPGCRLCIALTMWAACLALGLATRAHAHDIPTDVTINAFVKPLGERLQLIVRVPLKAMQEVDYPRRGPGYLDL